MSRESGRNLAPSMLVKIGLLAVVCMLATGAVYYMAGRWAWIAGAIFTSATVVFFSLRHVADRQMHFGREGFLQQFGDSLPGMIYQCRYYPTGHCAITYANDAIRWIYEKTLEEVQHDCSCLLDLLHPEDRPRVEKSLRESALSLEPWKGEYRVILPKQGVCWRFAQARVERLADGSTLWHGFIADVTARKEMDDQLLAAEQRAAAALEAARNAERKKLEMLSRLNESLREEASHDYLTGVFLRRYFDRRYPEIFDQARFNRPLTLVLCDIDHFKLYNDTFGHLAGDQCLKAVARALSVQINRKGQIFARYGGEEFVAVLPGLGPARAKAVGEKLRCCVEDLAIRAAGDSYSAVTVSVGVACLQPTSGEITHEDLLHHADEALYQAKHAGRNCVRILSLGSPGGEDSLRDRRLVSQDRSEVIGGSAG